MSTYYCHSCARDRRLVHDHQNQTVNLTGSNYLLGKFLKHTEPVTNSGVVSTYDDPTYKNYEGLTISGSASGAVEIDQRGRQNSIYYAGKDIGATYLDGVFQCPADAVKVVLTHDTGIMHSFPINSHDLQSTKCLDCGTPILI